MTINSSVATGGLEDSLKVIKVPAWFAKPSQKIKNIALGTKNIMITLLLGKYNILLKNYLVLLLQQLN